MNNNNNNLLTTTAVTATNNSKRHSTNHQKSVGIVSWSWIHKVREEFLFQEWSTLVRKEHFSFSRSYRSQWQYEMVTLLCVMGEKEVNERSVLQKWKRCGIGRDEVVRTRRKVMQSQEQKHRDTLKTTTTKLKYQYHGKMTPIALEGDTTDSLYLMSGSLPAQKPSSVLWVSPGRMAMSELVTSQETRSGRTVPYGQRSIPLDGTSKKLWPITVLQSFDWVWIESKENEMSCHFFGLVSLEYLYLWLLFLLSADI